jgi:hypothetical protein
VSALRATCGFHTPMSMRFNINTKVQTEITLRHQNSETLLHVLAVIRYMSVHLTLFVACCIEPSSKMKIWPVKPNCEDGTDHGTRLLVASQRPWQTGVTESSALGLLFGLCSNSLGCTTPESSCRTKIRTTDSLRCLRSQENIPPHESWNLHGSYDNSGGRLSFFRFLHVRINRSAHCERQHTKRRSVRINCTS